MEERHQEPLTKDEEWMKDQAHWATLREIGLLKKRLQELADYSDIAIDMSAQREYERIQKKLLKLEDSLPSA